MIDTLDARVQLLLTSIGAPYSWGAGRLQGAEIAPASGVPGLGGGRGWDCSGYAQWALVQLSLVRPDAWYDLTADDLRRVCDEVPGSRYAVGDLALYGSRSHVSHVMVVLGGGLFPMVIGASGGGRATNGNNPRACVQVRPLTYRTDLVMVGRIKPQWRPA